MVTAVEGQPAACAGVDRTGPRFVAYQPGAPVALETESHNFLVVMSSWELDRLAESLCAEAIAANGAAQAVAFVTALARLRQRWRALWARYGSEPAGWPLYQAELQRAAGELAPFNGRLRLPNGTNAVFAVEQWILLWQLRTARSRAIRPRKWAAGCAW